MVVTNPPRQGLKVINAGTQHAFITPVKQINDGQDVSFWLSSTAYTDVMQFLLQLNHAMVPRKSADDRTVTYSDSTNDTQPLTPIISQLKGLIDECDRLIDQAPPDPGPRRFGNASFRQWYQLVEDYLPTLFQNSIPAAILDFPHEHGQPSAKDELKAYFLGSFGSAQRLDFGTGHELSFLAFIGCIWKLGGFEQLSGVAEGVEKAIVLHVILPYLALVRKLITVYTLEPAGSHGVWGLDDHFFLPYIFGSAQLCPAISTEEATPMEGSLPYAPAPRDVTNKSAVERERKNNMYFEAIGFIYDVKKGPFWEHSPILYDVSGVTAGWGKINKGMIKMFNAEVLSKFPVVQHFPFGSLFRWERDPLAQATAPSTHTAQQPKAGLRPVVPTMEATTFPKQGSAMPSRDLRRPDDLPPVALPPPGPTGMPMTRAPWAAATTRPGGATPPPMTRMPAPSAMGRQPPQQSPRDGTTFSGTRQP